MEKTAYTSPQAETVLLLETDVIMTSGLELLADDRDSLPTVDWKQIP